MQTGNETWKWGVVFILLAIFLITANQAYQHVSNQEHFEPPDDYLKGDSWDLEHQGGPGAGQAVELPPDYSPDVSPDSSTSEEASEPMVIQEEIDWNNVKDPTKD